MQPRSRGRNPARRRFALVPVTLGGDHLVSRHLVLLLIVLIVLIVLIARPELSLALI